MSKTTKNQKSLKKFAWDNENSIYFLSNEIKTEESSLELKYIEHNLLDTKFGEKLCITFHNNGLTYYEQTAVFQLYVSKESKFAQFITEVEKGSMMKIYFVIKNKIKIWRFELV